MFLENHNLLKEYIKRIENVEEELNGLKESLKSIYDEVKVDGKFDPKIIKRVVSIRKKNRAEIEAIESVVDIYLHAIEGQ